MALFIHLNHLSYRNVDVRLPTFHSGDGAVWLVPTRIWNLLWITLECVRRESLTPTGSLETFSSCRIVYRQQVTARRQTTGVFFLKFMITNLNLCEETPNIKNVIKLGSGVRNMGGTAVLFFSYLLGCSSSSCPYCLS